MKKLNLLISLGFLSLICLTNSPKNLLVANAQEQNFKGQTLTIYNCEDYISTGEDDYVDIIGNFEKLTGCKVNYYTYDTNETMYNQFKLQKEGTYDLVCTSDYMIQKMVKEGLVEKYDDFETSLPNYAKYGSNALRSKLKAMKAIYNNEEVNLDQFAVGYMWGTLGIIYDPNYVDSEDVKSWDVFWDNKYKDLISIKNSMRDTFVVGLMHRYSKDENFKTLMNNYINDPSQENCDKYNELIQNIFDFKLDGSSQSDKENKDKIQAVKEELIDLKNNIFGFEVDSGKNDIITGKIKMNLAWSGDAVYSKGTALDEINKVLDYSVPLDGGNVWYDGWMLPHGANKDLAYAFLNYLSDPQNAADNMDYIGYTPFIVGNEIFTLVSSWYGAADYEISNYYAKDTYVIYDNKLYVTLKEKDAEEEIYPTNNEYFDSLEYDNSSSYIDGDMVSCNGKIFNCVSEKETTNTLNFDTNGNLISPENLWVEVEKYDLSYLFEDSLNQGRNAYIYPFSGSENTLETQYPTKEIIARCGIMNDFDSYNDDVIIMWGQIKAYTNMTPIYIFLIIVLILCVSGISYYIIKKRLSAHYKRTMNK